MSHADADGPRVGRPLIAWIAIVLMVVAVAVLQSSGPAPDEAATGGTGETGPLETALTRFQSRLLLGPIALPELLGTAPGEGDGPAGLEDRERDALMEQAATALRVGTLHNRLRFVAFARTIGGDEAAREELERIRTDLAAVAADPSRSYEPPEADLALLAAMERAVADEDGAREADRTSIEEGMGWFGRLFVVGPTEGPARDAVLRPAAITFGYLAVLLILVGGAAVLGLGGLITMIVLAATGRVRSGIEPRPRVHGVYAETFAVWGAAFVGLQLVAGTVVALLPSVLGPFALGVSFLAFMSSLVVLAWPARRGRMGLGRVAADVGLALDRHTWREVLLGVAGYAMTLPIVGVALVITLGLVRLQMGALGGEAPLFESATGPAHPIIGAAGGSILTTIQLLLVGAVAAPIVEETFFRGALYRHLRDASRGLGILASIALSTLLNTFIFAIIHPQGLLGVPLLMSLAVGFTLMREWRGSLVSSIVMHACNNGLVLGSVSILLSL